MPEWSGGLTSKERAERARFITEQAARGRAEEARFQQWYAIMARAMDLDPNPDDPRHFYDYRAAFRAGARPDQGGHWPSQFKREGHPNLIVNGRDTRETTKPVNSAMSMIAALLSGDNPTSRTLNSLPPIPLPTPSRLMTGNATVDNASEWMPEEQRRVVGHLRARGQLDVVPLPGIAGSYTPSRGMQVDPTLSETEVAKTLTHEATHALQPQGWFDQWLQRTREPLPPAASTGVPYLDKPREREAFLAEKLVRR